VKLENRIQPGWWWLLLVIIDLNGRLLDKAGQDATIFSHSSKWENLSFIVVKNLSFEAS